MDGQNLFSRTTLAKSKNAKTVLEERKERAKLYRALL
jgi:hypothetical protein